MWAVVECPNCNSLRIARRESKNVKCYNCGMVFTINPKRKFSRIVCLSDDIEYCRYVIKVLTSSQPIVRSDLL
jgi:predicted Zn-ribbon and HTH transcriptional regulator